MGPARKTGTRRRGTPRETAPQKQGWFSSIGLVPFKGQSGMSRFPRLAVGTLQPGVDATAITWALMDSLESVGLRVQSFLSRACFAPRDGATAITGLSPRHLDSWLMSEDL